MTKIKPVKAWAYLQHGKTLCAYATANKAYLKKWALPHDQIVRVEIRVVQPKRKGRM